MVEPSRLIIRKGSFGLVRNKFVSISADKGFPFCIKVNNYDKYLLDIDKVMHFPISFVIKTRLSKERVLTDMEQYIAHRSSGMAVLEERYHKAIEEIITINVSSPINAVACLQHQK